MPEAAWCWLKLELPSAKKKKPGAGSTTAPPPLAGGLQEEVSTCSWSEALRGLVVIKTSLV